MAKKIGRVMGQRHNWEDGQVVSTTLFFHDGTSTTVEGEVDLILGETLELTGNGPAPFSLTGVSPVQNGAT